MFALAKSKLQSIKLADLHPLEKINKIKKPKSFSFFIALGMNYFVSPLMTTFSIPVLVAPFVLLLLALFGQSIPITFDNMENTMRSIFNALVSGDVVGGMKKVIGDIDKSAVISNLKMFSLNNMYLALTTAGAVLFFLFAQNIYRYTNMLKNLEEKKYVKAFREFSVSFAPLLTVAFFYLAFTTILTAMKSFVIILIMFFASPIGWLGAGIDSVLRFAVVIATVTYLGLLFLSYKKIVFPLLYNMIEAIMYTGFYLTKWLRTPLTVLYRVIWAFAPILIGTLIFGINKEVLGGAAITNLIWSMPLFIFYTDRDIDSRITSSYVHKGIAWAYQKLSVQDGNKIVPKLPKDE